MNSWPAALIKIFILIGSLSLPLANADLNECENSLKKISLPFLVKGLPDMPGARMGPVLHTLKGESFIVFSHNNQTGVFEAASKQVRIYEQGAFDDVADIFESRSGRVVFAYTTSTGVKVFDVRRGRSLLDIPYTGMRSVHSVRTQLNPESPLFRPIFYETGRNISVAIVPRRDEFSMEPNFFISLVSINLTSKTIKFDKIRAGIFRYARMSDGHLYAMGWERNAEGYPANLLVRDLSYRVDVLREEFAHTQDPPIISGRFSLFFNSNNRPELVVFLNGPSAKVLFYDRTERRFAPLKGVQRVLHSGIQFFRDEQGKPWYAAIEGSESGRLAPDHFRLVIHPLEGLNGAIAQDINLEHPENDVRDIEVLERPEGRLILAWEQTFSNGQEHYVRAHIFNQKTRKFEMYRVPGEWKGAAGDSSAGSAL